MGISKEEAIKELQNRETVFVAYSQATKLPYVKCDEETYNDQAWIFSTEEGIKEFGKKMIEDKILLMGMRFSKKDYPRLYGTFYAIGVNTVVWVDGEDKIEIDLPDIAKQADMSKIGRPRDHFSIRHLNFPVFILYRNSPSGRERSAWKYP